MREESQLDDMRAAIRGDFERLERRRGVQELMHLREIEPEPLPELPEQLQAPSDKELRGTWLARFVAAISPRQV